MKPHSGRGKALTFIALLLPSKKAHFPLLGLLNPLRIYKIDGAMSRERQVILPVAQTIQMSDDELIRLLREEPEKGCEALLRQYTPLVHSVCRRRLSGCCTAEDIEEIAADILFKCWQHRADLSTAEGSIRAYIATLAVRRCIDHYRSIANKPVSQPVEPLADTLADQAQTPEEYYITEERKQNLLSAVKSLGEPDTEIILRKYYQNETAAEIARALSMTVGAIEMRLTRARKKLKELLGGDGHDA